MMNLAVYPICLYALSNTPGITETHRLVQQLHAT